MIIRAIFTQVIVAAASSAIALVSSASTLTVSTNALADARPTPLQCRLVAGKGPFKTFKFNQTAITFEDVRWKTSSGAVGDHKIGGVEVIKERDGSDLNAYYFATEIDWGAGRLFFSKDDDGIHAMVSFWSDSGNLSGYYSCH